MILFCIKKPYEIVLSLLNNAPYYIGSWVHYPKEINNFHIFQATDMRKIKLNSALITNEENERNRESSLLSMQFKIRRHHVKNARIEIRCEAKIFNMFSRTRDKEIFVKTHSAENQHQPQNNFHSSQPSSTIIFEFGKFKIIILLTFFSFICA